MEIILSDITCTVQRLKYFWSFQLHEFIDLYLKWVVENCSINMLSYFQIHRRLLNREMPMLPKLSIGIVDVRDVAAAHIMALTSSKAPG